MDELIPSPEFEKTIRQSFGVPSPRPDFVARLEAELQQQAAQKRGPRSLLGLRPAWTIAIAVLCLLIIATLAIGPQRVYAAVTRFLGYLPGVGIVDQASPIRVLAAPVSLTRDGITLTVESAFLTETKTSLTYTVENVPASDRPQDENVAGCSQTATLVLPDGTSLAARGGQGTGTRFEGNYPPIPAGVEQARFVLPCVFETLPGKAPEDWEITLQFAAAPPDLTLAPVIDLATPSLPAATDASMAVASPQPTAAMPYGIRFVLDQAIPIDDGYYLIGHSTWSDPRITSVYPDFKAFDAAGQEIPLEQAFFSDAGLDPQPDHWLFKLYGKIFSGPLTLRAAEVGVELAQPVTVTFDPAAYGFDGTDAQLDRVALVSPGIPIQALDMTARIVQLKYLKQGGEKGFEVGIEGDPALLDLPLSLASPVTGGRGASGGGSTLDDATGRLVAYVLSDGQMNYPVTFSLTGFHFTGGWETSWNPPAGTTDVTPTPISQACLTLAGWKAALKDPASLPAGLGGKVLLQRLNGSSYSLVVANLDGSGAQTVVDRVINPTSSLSPGGDRLVYADQTSIVVVDVQSGQRTALTTGGTDALPSWSPDGRQIAFIRRGDDGDRVYVMDADGGNPHAITPAGNLGLAGWTPDSARVLYRTYESGKSGQIHLADTATGAVSDLFAVQMVGPAPAISPDGQWIAFVDRVPGWTQGGLYISHLDGSDRRLMVELEDRSVGAIHWSPDGQWLAFVTDDNQFYGTTLAGLLNVATCQVVPLKGVDGVIADFK